MTQYIIELSGYCSISIMVLYVVFYTLAFLTQIENNKALYTLQGIMVFIVQLCLFSSLILETQALEILLFYLFVQVFLLTVLVITPFIYKSANRLLLNTMSMCIGIGLYNIARISMSKAIRQYMIVLISLAIGFFLPYIIAKCRFLKVWTWIYASICFLCLGAVYLLGEITHGSKLSYTIADSITFQPSEFVKIIFVFFLAAFLYQECTFKRIVFSAVCAGGLILILTLSKDLGSALIYFVTYVFVVFIASGNPLYLLAGCIGGITANIIAYRFFNHVKVRIDAWRNPFAYIDNKGYAITQSLFAIGSGSWFGMGIMKGNPKSIPYVEQDFIFSSLCEELGAVFSICLLCIIFLTFLEICKIALNTENLFYRMIAAGLGVMYIFQTFLTVGGGMNLIPLTGVTLPFLSYGGSSCMTSVFMIFIIQGIYITTTQTLHSKQ